MTLVQLFQKAQCNYHPSRKATDVTDIHPPRKYTHSTDHLCEFTRTDPFCVPHMPYIALGRPRATVQVGCDIHRPGSIVKGVKFSPDGGRN